LKWRSELQIDYETLTDAEPDRVNRGVKPGAVRASWLMQTHEDSARQRE